MIKEEFTTIYQRICNERQRLENELRSIEHQLEPLPDGKLICARNGNSYKWYQSDGKNRIYIPKKNRSLAEELAIKKYLTARSEELRQEIRAIDFYLRHHNSFAGKAEKFLTEIPEYRNLLAPYFKPFSNKISEWISSPYERNMKYPEKRNLKTISGNFVRSKSEVIIDYVLYIHKVPFRYECALSLGEATFYPDFTIMHPHTGKIYYWITC